ncbi:aminoglycoside phosphotransferase family protein [Nodularia spumigena CS-591/04]|uniref:aminoglycoside phosphotransferase family protein n=1 Tax=Nodularia spumigena TaxID=70799 RepID=UPI00232D7B8F|nr:aminoglycoside phosphotransferase family protein [Nodularia spumigena]MDB9323242.1 aminoglycoside phosphotransferase family protein [Nodularia spumigena CS-591/07A]MDB9331172.1 aminoglycoside phosphotransferase family protein [Nodularia spumigena CS-591/04]
MTFILNSDNAFDYLLKQGLLDKSQQPPSKIEPVAAKNFNLLLTFTEKHKLLIKQERLNQEGKASGEFLIEWRIQEFIQRFPELDNYRQVLPEVLHFDVENSIIVFRYLDDYRDLMDFYTKEKSFPTEIATAIGTLLATIHRDTFNHQEYEDFFTKNSVNFNQISNLALSLGQVKPEIFGLVPDDGLKFFALYQRYDSLGQAIAELGQSVKPACVTHNDLKLNNILLRNNWQDSHNIIRFIDWERSAWGDPAFDLGTIIGNYVQIWLGSLVISNSLSIEESLRLAITPLELLQPSIGALTKAYLNTFPEILEHHPDYLQRVVQFAGFNLIQQIQAMLQYQRSFSNMGIAMMQVAKALLSRPVQSIPTIFGAAAEELTSFNRSAV